MVETEIAHLIRSRARGAAHAIDDEDGQAVVESQQFVRTLAPPIGATGPSGARSARADPAELRIQLSTR